jgi:hypothetical protein
MARDRVHGAGFTLLVQNIQGIPKLLGELTDFQATSCRTITLASLAENRMEAFFI